MHYKIVYAEHAEYLEAMVNKLLSDGWCPLGNVSVRTADDEGVKLYQALIRNE